MQPCPIALLQYLARWFVSEATIFMLLGRDRCMKVVCVLALAFRDVAALVAIARWGSFACMLQRWLPLPVGVLLLVDARSC